jgi:hypothetical protein
MKKFEADKINYIVNCLVIDDNRFQLVARVKASEINL